MSDETNGLFDESPHTPPVGNQGPRKPPKLYPIPADNSRQARCSGDGCDAVIYWVQGTRFPISADCEGGSHPAAGRSGDEKWNDGAGVSHYTNCPAARQFSGRNRGK